MTQQQQKKSGRSESSRATTVGQRNEPHPACVARRCRTLASSPASPSSQGLSRPGLNAEDSLNEVRTATMAPRLVDYLLYEPEDSGIAWIRFDRPERLNALVGAAEEDGTIAK